MDAPSLAALTVDRARTAMQSARIASLPEVVKLLRTLSGNSQDVSVIDLAEVIQGDPLVMAKVIEAANMFAYNPNGVEVTSVTQAIHVIGYERIRTLAMSLMLAEQVSRTHSQEAQREYAGQSLMAGCIAQALASRRAMLDKEQAFICASLRNFGHIVLTACMAEEFQQLCREVSGAPTDEDYRRVFGLTPLELGHQLLDAANLPEEILVTLRAIPSEAFAVLERTPEDQMRALTAFAGELSTLTFDSSVTPEDFAAKSDALARRFEHVLPLLHEEVHFLMASATLQLDQIVRTFRIKSLPPRLLTRMAKCRNAVDPNRPPPEKAETAKTPPGSLTTAPFLRTTSPAVSGVTTPAFPVPSAPPTPPAAAPGYSAPLSANPLQTPHDWDNSLARLADLWRNPAFSRSQRFGALLEIVRAGLHVPDCLLFSTETGRQGFPLTHGLGRTYEQLSRGRAPEVVKGERTVLGICLSRNENIIIHNAREEKILPYLPAWIKQQANFGAFVLLPVTDGAALGGVLVAGWSDPRQVVLAPDCVRTVRTMLALACREAMRPAA